MTIRRVVIFLYHFGANLQPEGDSRRLLTGAKLSAAGGRSSEAAHGQRIVENHTARGFRLCVAPVRVVGLSPTWGAIKETTFVYHDKGCFFVLFGAKHSENRIQ